jgi:signal transduction histidine kinase
VELERRVAERNGQLQAAHAARLRYLAAAGHDLRQPLVSIGLLGKLLGQQELPAPAADVLSRLEGAVEHMDDLFERLLAFSCLEAAAVQPKLEALPVQRIFEAVASHAHAHAQARGLRLRMRSTRAVVVADNTLLEQIVRNLVGNALRYTAAGSVLVAVRAHGPGWRLEVRDSGPGIAADDHARIFDEFVRLPQPVSVKVSQQAVPRDIGLGLGLAIAQRQAHLLGSRIELNSALGRGSRFWLALPRA